MFATRLSFLWPAIFPYARSSSSQQPVSCISDLAGGYGAISSQYRWWRSWSTEGTSKALRWEDGVPKESSRFGTSGRLDGRFCRPTLVPAQNPESELSNCLLVNCFVPSISRIALPKWVVVRHEIAQFRHWFISLTAKHKWLELKKSPS